MITPSINTQIGYTYFFTHSWTVVSSNNNTNSNIASFTPTPIGSIWVVGSTVVGTPVGIGTVNQCMFGIQKTSWTQDPSTTNYVCGSSIGFSNNYSSLNYHNDCSCIYKVVDNSALVLGMFLNITGGTTLNFKFYCTRIA
jgi:hypothetical protein